MTSIYKHLALAALIAIGFARAQEAPKEFEVASIKPAEPGAHGAQFMMSPGGRLVVKNITARFLIQEAYGVKDFQVSGAPGWTGSERYDINAKGDASILGPEQLRPLMQSLLAERFKLQIHRESKELPVYALVVGKNGPKLKESAGAPSKRNMMRMGRGLIDAQGASMTMFATQLSQQLGRSVIDKTGLTGAYDVKLEWTPDEGEGPGPKEPGSEGTVRMDSAGPTIFTALQEQLGLKLEGQKGPVEIIVVDKIEKPTEN